MKSHSDANFIQISSQTTLPRFYPIYVFISGILYIKRFT